MDLNRGAQCDNTYEVPFGHLMPRQKKQYSFDGQLALKTWTLIDRRSCTVFVVLASNVQMELHKCCHIAVLCP